MSWVSRGSRNGRASMLTTKKEQRDGGAQDAQPRPLGAAGPGPRAVNHGGEQGYPRMRPQGPQAPAHGRAWGGHPAGWLTGTGKENAVPRSSGSHSEWPSPLMGRSPLGTPRHKEGVSADPTPISVTRVSRSSGPGPPFKKWFPKHACPEPGKQERLLITQKGPLVKAH